MRGFAEKLLMKNGLIKSEGNITHPLIHTFLDLKALHYFDYSLAKELLQGGSENQLLFLCYLSKASRLGNLCVKISEDELEPDPISLFQENEEIKITPLLPMLIRNGIKSFPKDLINENSNHPPAPIYKEGDFFYFQKNYLTEKEISDQLNQHLSAKPTLAIPESFIQKELEDTPLLPEQKEGIIASLQHSISIIAGGPGTGKTYTAGQLIKIFLQFFDGKNIKVGLAAPTGKAAANLSLSLSKALPNTDLQAKTLHSLLQIKKHRDESEVLLRLPFDLLIVDEGSMIDASLMKTLLQSMKKGSRLILLGDPYQLPAIGSGAIFTDFMTLFNTQNLKNVISLKKSVRTNLKPILDLSHAIKTGDFQAALKLLNEEHECLEYVQMESKNSHHIISYAVQHFSNISWRDDFNQFRILSPLRQGSLGIDQLNSAILSKLLKKCEPNTPLYAPIMITQNNKEYDLYNGEMGILSQTDLSLKKGDYALFIKTDGEVKKIPALLLPSFEYAYCISVHKSQGSEFEHVVLLLPDNSELFGVEILYTGITRAKKKLEIWGNDSLLQKIIERKNSRLSCLSVRSSKN